MMLKKKQLGTSALMVSEACLGTMMMGSKNTPEESFKQLDYFLEHGGNFIDTAELYAVPTSDENAGASEDIVGQWLAARGCRDKVILATKVVGPMAHNRYPANRVNPKDPDAPKPRLERDQILAAIDGSLRRMQTDYIDLYQLHWPERYVPGFGYHMYDPSKVRPAHSFESIVKAMGDALATGKVKYWGLSNESAYGVTMMCEEAKRQGVPLPITIQNDFSLCDRHFELDLAEACYVYGIKLLPYGVLGGGYLSGKYRNGAKPEGSRHTINPDFQPRYSRPAVAQAVEKYAALAEKLGISMTTLAVAWAAGRWHMGSVITGQTSVEQLEEYLKAFEVELSEETLTEIDRIHREDRNPHWSD